MKMRVNELPDKADRISIDMEMVQSGTPRLHRPGGRFLSLCIFDGNEAYVIENPDLLPRAADLILSASTVYVHNAAFDLYHLSRLSGRDLFRARFFDVFLAERAMFSGFYDSFSLSDMSVRYLGRPLSKVERAALIRGFGGTLFDSMDSYVAQDAEAAFRIGEIQRRIIPQDVLRCLSAIDFPAVRALRAITDNGIMIDRRRWEDLAYRAADQAARIRNELGFNPASSQQVIRAFSRLGVHLDSTAEGVLSRIRKPKEAVELARKILAFREAYKMSTSYGVSFLDYVEEDGRVHADYNVYGAETGRTSSSDPNMQNIPRSPEYRACFIAPPDHVLIVADYSAQEPRIAAQLAGEERLIRAFAEGRDVYLAVASAVFGVEIADKKDPRRDVAKRLFLAVTYGMSARSLAAHLEVSEDEAAGMLEKFFRSFPALARWRDRQIRLRQYVSSLGGRRFHLNPHTRGSERNALNMPIQGTAADISKSALIRMIDAGLKVVGFIHDEFIVEAPREKAQETAEKVREIMLNAMQRMLPDVKPEASVAIGDSWACKS
jgi:DNA polymerase-1